MELQQHSPAMAQFTYYLPETQGGFNPDCGQGYFVDQLTLDSPPTVDNSQNRYVAGFKFTLFGPSQMLVGLRIGYSFP